MFPPQVDVNLALRLLPAAQGTRLIILSFKAQARIPPGLIKILSLVVAVRSWGRGSWGRKFIPKGSSWAGDIFESNYYGGRDTTKVRPTLYSVYGNKLFLFLSIKSQILLENEPLERNL